MKHTREQMQEETTKRIQACLVACAGIHDPVKTVPELVEALQSLLIEYVAVCENIEIEHTGKDPEWEIKHKEGKDIPGLCGCDVDGGPACGYCKAKQALEGLELTLKTVNI